MKTKGIGRCRFNSIHLLSWPTLVAMALLFVSCSGGSGSSSTCATGLVTTTSGTVCGKITTAAGSAVHAFLGIPFGESTAGDNRWQDPVPKAQASAVIDATEFGPGCPQTLDPPYSPPNGTSEDCLTLNVWRRADLPGRGLRPVMIWMYGGSFRSGGSSMPIYDGAYLAATQDVVLVTINYRLGALGFLAGIHGLEGNYGLKDQQLAFEWVHDNIQNFGGDPDKVTIFGESAGAMSVGLHLLSIPSSSGLFRGGIMQSNPFGIPYKTVSEAATEATLLEAALGCAGEELDCLRAVAADDIVQEQGNTAIQMVSLLGLHLAGFLVWAPVIDGTFLIEDPTVSAEEGGLTLPIILGTTHDEGVLFVKDIASAFGGTISAATYLSFLTLIFGADNATDIISIYGIDLTGDNSDILSQIVTDYLFGCANRFVANQARSGLYAYEFDENSINIWPDVQECDNKACHGDDLPFTFHTDTQIGTLFTQEQGVLSDQMIGYWGAFAAALTPNVTGQLPWPEFTPSGLAYMILVTPQLRTAIDPMQNCAFWDQIGYDLRPPLGLAQK
ncbi:MAG: carboxylesterase family protein [Deltaproteobacteria bacterium]|nr:carboxylesterase family protein [Deltaproteobacteria bacterium]